MDAAVFDETEDLGLSLLAELAGKEAQLFAALARQLQSSMLLSRRLEGADAVERFLLMDVAGTLRIGQLAACSRLDEAERLVQVMVRTLAGLEDGSLLLGQSRIVLAETRNCSEQVAAEVERRVLTGTPAAELRGWTAKRLRARVAAEVLLVEAELEPAATEERLADAVDSRRVSVRPDADGMANLWALLPADGARVFTLGLDELHRRQLVADRASGIERTADQRRADLLVLLPGLALHALDGTDPAARAVRPGAAASAGSSAGAGAGAGGGSGAGAGGGSGAGAGSGANTSAGSSAIPAASQGGAAVGDSGLSPAVASGCGCAMAGPLAIGAAGHGSVVLNICVPVVSALGLSEHPGEVPGYGPLAASQIRLLLPTAQLRRVLVEAGTGEPLHAEPALPGPAGDQATARAQLLAMVPEEVIELVEHAEPQYEPSTGLARFVRLRDEGCCGPGCASTSRHSDLDHAVPYPLGPTASWNLDPKSRRCHRAKTVSWEVTEHPDGAHLWTSPTGRSYPVPAPWTPPPDLLISEILPALPTKRAPRPWAGPYDDGGLTLTDPAPAPAPALTPAFDDEPPF